MRDTAVATVHSGNSSFARIILTSKSIVIHSILNVQLQKGAYLFSQNEILNSTVRLCGGIYSNTVDIYYFI